MVQSHLSSQDAIIDGMMAVIARDGWRATTLDAIAQEAKISATDIALQTGGRFDILSAFGKRADRIALKEADEEGGSQAVRDRLFALLMARLDALAPHKAAVRQLARASRSDPGLAAFFVTQLPRSLRLIAEVAGVDTSGLIGAARVKALCALYLGVARRWLDDDSEDQGKTMAALDKALARANRWENQFDRFCSPRGAKASAKTGAEQVAGGAESV